MKIRKIIISTALAAITLIAYEPIRRNEFVNYDDNIYITKNPNVTSGITRDSVIWAFTNTHASNWHPLTWLSHMLDYQLFGPNPLGHHLVSLLFHIVNALLLFLVLTNMTGSIWPSAFVAAVFAIHPLQVESVAWAAERKNVLSGFFWILTMLAYVRYAKRPNFKRYLLVLLAFVMGIMSKPMVVTLPFVLLLLDYWPLERIGRQMTNNVFQKASAGRLIVEKIPLFILSAASSLITIIAQKSGGAVIALERIPLNYRIANVPTSYIRYIGKMIWPSRLPVYYSDPNINPLDARAIICAVILVMITVLSIYTARRRKYVGIGWLWYVGTLVPMIGLVQVGSQAMANRYMYVSMLGLLIIVAWFVKDIVIKLPGLRIIVIMLAAAALTSSVIITRKQVKHWENSLALFEYTLEVTENNELAENNYGCALTEANRLDEAAIHFKNALRILPKFTEARDNLGKIYMQQRKISEAIECFKENLQQNENSAATHFKLAFALMVQKKYNEAIEHLRRILKIDPNFSEARKTLGMALMAVGRSNEAISYLKEALKQDEDSVETHYNLAVALGMQKNYAEAIYHLNKVLVLDPNHPDARNKMVLALLASGRPNEAVTHLNKLLQQNRNSAEIHYKLALAFSMQNKNNEAIQHLTKVIELDPNYPDVHNKLALALMATGKINEAITHFKQALRTDNDKAEIYEKLGIAYSLLGKNDLTIHNWSKAAELRPNDAGILNNLAWLLATVSDTALQDADRAIEIAERACKITEYKQPNLLDTLAASYAAAGRFEDAVKTAQQAIDAAKARGQDELAGKIEKRKELYQTGKGYIQR